jgi:hypothetical protein
MGMNELEDLQVDHLTLTTILLPRRAVSMEGISMSVCTPWTIYLNILEDAVKTLQVIGNMFGDTREKR